MSERDEALKRLADAGLLTTSTASPSDDEIIRTTPYSTARRAGELVVRRLKEMEVRKSVLPLAISVVGPQPSTMSPDAIADRVELVANRFVDYVVKDDVLARLLATTPEVKP